jgi:hypothetical protein
MTTAAAKKRPQPHDFTQSLDQFEEAVFVNADHFVLARRLGVGEYYQMQCKTWPEVKALIDHVNIDQIFIYAVTAEGRSTLLNGARMRNGRWDQLWQKWRAAS